MGGAIRERLISGKFYNFAIERYKDPLNRAELPADLWSLLAEMDVMKESIGGATVRQMILVPGEGFFHQVEGEWIKYTQFYDRAIGSVNSLEVKDRFRAERLGWERAENVLEDGSSEVVVVASPPGEIYRFADMEPLSATFVLARREEGEVEIGEVQAEGVIFDAFSLYVDEISVEEHLQILGEVGEFVDQLEVINSLSLVAMPLILERTVEKLNTLVRGLGFESWEKVRESAVRLQEVQKQGSTERDMRRQQITQMLADAVDLSLIKNGEFEPVLVAEAVKRVLAKEAIGHYLDKEVEQIQQDIQLTIYTLHREEGKQVVVGQLVDPFTYDVWREDQKILLENEVFQRMMSAHGGGGLMVGPDGKSIMIDWRTDVVINNDKREKTLKCGGCKHSFLSEKTPCDCPNCGKKVFKGES